MIIHLKWQAVVTGATLVVLAAALLDIHPVQAVKGDFKVWQIPATVSMAGTVTIIRQIGYRRWEVTVPVSCIGNTTSYNYELPVTPKSVSWKLNIAWGCPKGHTEVWEGTNQPWPKRFIRRHICDPPEVSEVWEGEVGFEEVIVGGIWVPVDKFGLLAPYIGLASTIVAATVATAIYAKRVKHRKNK